MLAAGLIGRGITQSKKVTLKHEQAEATKVASERMAKEALEFESKLALEEMEWWAQARVEPLQGSDRR